MPDYRLNIQSPSDAILSGLRTGAGFTEIRQNQLANQLAIQQKQQEMRRQQQQYEAVGQFLESPSYEGLMRVSAFVDPKQAEAISSGFSGMQKEQRQSLIGKALQVSSALMSSTPQVGIDILEQMAEAAGNSGDEEQARAYMAYADAARENPRMAASLVMLPLSHSDEGKTGLQSLFDAQKNPALVEEGEAKAKQEEVKAKYAESQALLDLEKTGWDIKAIQNDMYVKKVNSRIYAIQAALARETNALKRQELEMQLSDRVRERDQAIRDKAAEAETVMTSLSDIDSTLTDILGDEDTLRAAVGTGAFRGAIPGTKARTMAGKIEQLQNMMTEANLGKLKGAMSDSDLKFLRNISTNMDRYQNEEGFIAELKRVQSVVARSKVAQSKRYGIPSIAPQTPSEEADIDALLLKYGGK